MTKADQARRLAWRFKVLQQACEETRNVARTCRHFGISRQAYYRWKRRYETHGAAAGRSAAVLVHDAHLCSAVGYVRSDPRESVSVDQAEVNCAGLLFGESEACDSTLRLPVDPVSPRPDLSPRR
jgi:transposase-like protein